MNWYVFLLKLTLCFYLITLDDLVTCSISIFNSQNQTIEIIDSVSAAFGPSISEFGFKGYVVVANPIGGCSPLQKPPNVSFVDEDQWIVLIKRTPTVFGNCSFDLKVRNAQLAGFKAVIIYNSESDNLIKMSSSGKYDIEIPSVFISQSDGTDIGTFFTYKNRTFVVINDDDDNLNYLLIPFICVVAVCFVIAISIFVSKFVIHVYKLRKNRFPKSALKKIPTKKYQKTDKYDTCPICLNEYEEGEKMRILPCEHAYHVECIDKWLLRNNRFCPVCKRRVLPGGSDSESDDGREQTTVTSIINVPNEDENTNENSRLLIRNNSDDNLSSVTVSTTVTNNPTTETQSQVQNANIINSDQTNTDLSSMNNRMTVSLTSSQAQQNLNKDPPSSSSRYGSISSSLNILTNPTTSKSIGPENNSDSETEPTTSTKKEAISNLQTQQQDSKATPDFHSPIEDSLPKSTPQNPSTNLPQTLTKPGKKRNSKNKKNKVNQQPDRPEETKVVIENEVVAESDNDSLMVETDDDKKVLLEKREKSVKNKQKKKSNRNTNEDENNDDPIV